MKRSLDADLEVVLADGTIWVESSILRIASPFFKAMLSTDMKESREWKISLPDKTVETFQLFYDFLLPATLKEITTTEIAESIVVLAKEYCIDTLQTKCELFLVNRILHLEVSDAHIVAQIVADKFIFAKRCDLKQVVAAALDFVIKNNDPGILFAFLLHPQAFNAMEDCDLAYKVPSLKQCFTLSQVLHKMLTFSDRYLGGDGYCPQLTGQPDTANWFARMSHDVGFYRHDFCRGPLRSKEFAVRSLMCYLKFIATNNNESGKKKCEDRRKAYVYNLGEIYKDWKACNDDSYLHFKDADDKIDLLEGYDDDRDNRPVT